MFRTPLSGSEDIIMTIYDMKAGRSEKKRFPLIGENQLFAIKLVEHNHLR